MRAVLTVAGAWPVVMPEARCQVSNGLAESACSKRVRAVTVSGKVGFSEALEEGTCDAGTVVGGGEGVEERIFAESNRVEMLEPSIPSPVAFFVGCFGFSKEDP